MSIGPQNKLELFTGIPASNQQILLLNNENETDPIANLSDNSKALGFYSVRDWQVLKVRAVNGPRLSDERKINIVDFLGHRYQSVGIFHWPTDRCFPSREIRVDR